MYLVTIIKKNIKFVDFCLLTNLCAQVARCLDFWTKWSWGLCVIPIWWIAYNVNKLTHIIYLGMYLVTIIKKIIKFVNFFMLTNLCTQVARCLDFWTKWSGGLCVIPIWWVTYNVNKSTHKTYLVMYLVTILKKKKIKFVDFCLLTNLCTQVAPRCLDLWTKWSWGLCVIPIWWIAYNVNKLTHIIYLVMYLVTIIKKIIKFVDFSCLLIYAPKLPDALTFELNGHEASVWYQYDELHIMWTNWPI